MVRPRSASPFRERSSSCANFDVRSRWWCLGNACIARGRRARPRSGVERVSKKNVALLSQTLGSWENFLSIIWKSSSAFCLMSAF